MKIKVKDFHDKKVSVRIVIVIISDPKKRQLLKIVARIKYKKQLPPSILQYIIENRRTFFETTIYSCSTDWAWKSFSEDHGYKEVEI